MLYTSIHTMYILIAIWLVPGAGGIFPSEIIKSVSSLSGNLLNDLCCYVNKNLSMEPFFNLDYLCFHYYIWPLEIVQFVANLAMITAVQVFCPPFVLLS